MPTFNSTEYAAHVANPTAGVSVNNWGGRVRSRKAVSPGAVGLAENDFVRLFPILRGERPLFFIIENEANTAVLTADIGLEDGDEDKYIAAADVADTPAIQIIPSISRVAEATGGVVAMKLEGSNPSDTADITVEMVYVLD